MDEDKSRPPSYKEMAVPDGTLNLDAPAPAPNPGPVLRAEWNNLYDFRLTKLKQQVSTAESCLPPANKFQLVRAYDSYMKVIDQRGAINESTYDRRDDLEEIDNKIIEILKKLWEAELSQSGSVNWGRLKTLSKDVKEFYKTQGDDRKRDLEISFLILLADYDPVHPFEGRSPMEILREIDLQQADENEAAGSWDDLRQGFYAFMRYRCEKGGKYTEAGFWVSKLVDSSPAASSWGRNAQKHINNDRSGGGEPDVEMQRVGGGSNSNRNTGLLGFKYKARELAEMRIRDVRGDNIMGTTCIIGFLIFCLGLVVVMLTPMWVAIARQSKSKF